MSSENSPRLPDEPPRDGDEGDYLFNLRNFFIFLAALLVLALIVLGVSAVLLGGFTPERPPVLSGDAPPGPNLQVDPYRERQELEAEQLALLNSYEVIDQEAGIARIPIELAIRFTAGSGLPVEPNYEILNNIEADDSGFPHPTLTPFEPADSENLIDIRPFQPEEAE